MPPSSTVQSQIRTSHPHPAPPPPPTRYNRGGAEGGARRGGDFNVGDQRNVEPLVEGDFDVSETIGIATLSGAKFPGLVKKIGTFLTGKRADLVIMQWMLQSE